MKKIKLVWVLLALLCLSCSSKQKPDNDFDVSVTSPTFADYHPVVLLDEAQHNMHTASGTYKPFAGVLKNDGCIVEANTNAFSNAVLHPINVLVIANAKGGEHDFKERAAFTDSECNAVENWVMQGGALLFVADHYPFGSAAEKLSERFGVHMFNGETADSVYFEGDSSFRDKLVFSKQNGLLMQHAITNGLKKVVSDRGQSLSGPPNAIVLLKLSSHAYQTLPDSIWREGSDPKVRFGDPVSSKNDCQGLAMNYGKGRVVVLGEAAMITAQVYEGEKFGMNTPGNDNKQFVLNIIQWLGSK